MITNRRLRVDESLNCYEHIDWYFGVAAGMVALCFVVGVPVMYGVIIEGHCSMFSKVKCEGDTENDRWLRTMANTDNSAKSLYEMFERDWRYYKLIQNLQKLVLCVATVSLFTMTPAAVGLTSSCHGIFFFACLYTQPYIHSSTDYLSTLAMMCALMTSFVAMAQALKPKGESAIPSYIWGIVAASNIVLPILAGSVGAVFAYNQSQVRAVGEAQRDAMRQLKEDKDKTKEKSGDLTAHESRPQVPETKKKRGRGRVMEVRAARNPVTGEKPHVIFLKVSQNRRKDVEDFLMEGGVDPNISEYKDLYTSLPSFLAEHCDSTLILSLPEPS